MSLARIREGGKLAVSRALAALEGDALTAGSAALLDEAFMAPRGHAIGVTGPPGVGKSTLLGKWIKSLRRENRSVGVIAVDPSSRLSGGALLGDRIRFIVDPEDEGIYVRSMAARARLGGLADLTVPAMVLMRALYDVVLIETVGVGQSESDVAGVADTTVLCVQPGAGDVLQFMKAGLVEVPDIAVVTKADLGGPARRTLEDLKSGLALSAGEMGRWQVPALLISASTGEGLSDLLDAVETHRRWLETGLPERRRRHAARWVEDFVRDSHGREGLKRVGPISLAEGAGPFALLLQLRRRLGGDPTIEFDRP